MERIFIVQVDDRSGFRRDKHYPKLIFLHSVLRWAVRGNVSLSEVNDAIAIVRSNNSSLDSTAAFLADHIDSGAVPIYSVHAKLPLGLAEKNQVIEKLRRLDQGVIGGLVDEAGLNYYLGGHELFLIVMAATSPITDDFEQGGVWHRLAWDAPKEWHDEFNCVQTVSADQQNESTAEFSSDPESAIEASDFSDIERAAPCRQQNDAPKLRDKQRRQEKAIVDAVIQLGYDPKKLPKTKNGSSGVRSEVRKQFEIVDGELFGSIKTFNTAWERTKLLGDLKDA